LDVQQAAFTFRNPFTFLIAVAVGLDGDFGGSFVDPDPLASRLFSLYTPLPVA
jgi:hypothetical protein